MEIKNLWKFFLKLFKSRLLTIEELANLNEKLRQGKKVSDKKLRQGVRTILANREES